MPVSWGPSIWGKRWTGSDHWQLTLNEDELAVSLAETSLRTRLEALETPTIRRGLVWSAVDLRFEGQAILLEGVPNKEARRLKRALQDAVARHREQARLAGLRESFDAAAVGIHGWAVGFYAAARAHLASRGWLTREFQLEWECRKPGGDFQALLKAPDLAGYIPAQHGAIHEAIDLWKADLGRYIHAWNEKHFASELVTNRDFFKRVEKSPLTEEQARAVVCFDNRVQVIASAGSGKTSVMVAKAGYALHRNLVPAESILLLAFNAGAARELRQRLQDRLEPVGLPGGRIAAQTFHAFGLEIIGKATGRKPSLAPWLDSGQDLAAMMRIVDELRDASPLFRVRWDLYRMVLGRDLPAFGREGQEPEDWDNRTKTEGFRTLQGEVVKSHGERLIADWLFYNGVRYIYERPYEHDTTDAAHRQYCPDFYYPDIDAYHEHFALDRKGQPPPEFEGYLDGVAWKRSLHRQHHTTLLETTMANIWDGTAFGHLEAELTTRGIVLDPNPERPVPGKPPLDNEQLVRTFRTFLIHAKSNQLDDDNLLSRLVAERTAPFRFRHRMFLDLFAAIREAWDRKLATYNYIDFEDMLNIAADYLEQGTYTSGYELVMVDEMQDASHARARLARALVNSPGSRLFAVGDDWQSINRFAGADLSVMTDFERWFGPGETLRLERTFRSPQSICAIAGKFVQKNPQQLPKRVVSSTPESSPTIEITAVQDADRFAVAIERHLEELNRVVQAATDRTPAGRVQVRVLGRYRHHETHMPPGYTPGKGYASRWNGLDVRFSTVHGSKGLEADYIVVPGMTNGSFGFPSAIEDDPVLRLAMPQDESFPLAEERRLFYVALTRARRSVLLLTVEHKHSPFITELVGEQGLSIHNTENRPVSTTMCPECREGYMVPRTGRYGSFLGCSRYPKCRHTMKPSTQQLAGPGSR